MKNKHSFSLATAIAFIGLSASAQTWVNGGNSLLANGALGINTNYSLIFKTNKTERGRITNNGRWAIGSPGTSSKFTINSAAGISPLRAQISGSTKFIVNSNGGTSIGNFTPGPANGLYVAGSTGIGTATPSVNYKLHVEGTVYGRSASYVGVYGSSSLSFGVYGISDYIGVSGYSYSSGYGIYGYGSNAIYGLTPVETGVAIWGDATAESAYGIVGYSSKYIGILGSTGNSASWAGYFEGKVYSTGGYTSSDRKLKEEIGDVRDAMEIIRQLKPRTYKFRQQGDYKVMNLPQGKHYGLIAQEVETVLPNLIAEAEFNTARPRSEGLAAPMPGTVLAAARKHKGETISFKTLNYTELIPIVVKAIQEQQQVIEKLEENNSKQQQRIERLEQMLANLSGERNVKISGSDAFSVTPNPATGSVTIQYNLPEGSKRAQLLLTDVLGRNVKTVPLTGSGNVNLDVSKLSSGAYNCSLFIDNKLVQTKKMTVVP